MNAMRQLRRKLFHAISADVVKYRPEYAGKVLCPLSLEPFDSESIVTGRLSAEHIIPGALGGDAYTLTCGDLNNKNGAKIDSHLVNAMKALDGLGGKAPIRGTFRSEVGSVAVD